MYTQRKELTRIDKDMQKEFVKSQGPFVEGLDKALDSSNVHQQAYYSGTFVGNHVHTSLKVHFSIQQQPEKHIHARICP